MNQGDPNDTEPPGAKASGEDDMKLSDADLVALEEAARRLDADPMFHAEVVKGLFVDRVLAAMEERGDSLEDLARRWGKTPEHVSRVLNEDWRGKLTVETLCEMAHHLGRRIEILMLQPGERALVTSHGEVGARGAEDAGVDGGHGGKGDRDEG